MTEPRNSSSPQTLATAFASLFSTTGLILVIFYLAYSLSDQILTDLIENELMNPQGASNWIWVYGAVSFSMGLIAPLLISFLALCAWRFPGESLLQVAGRHFSYLVREEMRVFGKSILWGLLLVIPGLVRFFQWLFVPYIVLLDPGYQRGEVDALKRSTKSVGQVWGRLLGLFILFGILLPLGFTTLDEWRSLLLHPVTGLPLALIELTLLLIFQWLILKSWEKTHVLDVPLV